MENTNQERQPNNSNFIIGAAVVLAVLLLSYFLFIKKDNENLSEEDIELVEGESESNNEADSEINQNSTNETDMPAETTDEGNSKIDEEGIYEFSSVQPEYPGGIEELAKIVQKEYDIPSSYLRSGEEGGTIVTRFVVLEDGSIGQVKILKTIPDCEECTEEAITTINEIDQKFMPGTEDGKPVKVWYTLPIVVQVKTD